MYDSCKNYELARTICNSTQDAFRALSQLSIERYMAKMPVLPREFKKIYVPEKYWILDTFSMSLLYGPVHKFHNAKGGGEDTP